MSWRLLSGAGAGGERGLNAVISDEGRVGRCPAPTSAFPGQTPALSDPSCQNSLSAGRVGATLQITYPRLTAIPVLFFPILQKLEFGPRFHVPNYVFTDLGQEKTERRESFYSALKKKLTERTTFLHVGFATVMEMPSFVLPAFCRSLRNADETGSITVCLS